ncbi:MAG: pantoate--beta-alanine ligase [Crocinitomicaceae bacterium]
MKIVKTKHDLQQAIELLKKDRLNAKVGFVPTMGALHQGHASLVKKAKEHADIVVVSIFVNPTQFNNADDLKRYPRTFEADVQLLENEQADLLFYPEVEAVYEKEITEIKVDLKGLDLVMEGEFRPGHFKGVVQVVHRLFDLVQPDIAFFGQKDFQQLSIIRQMTNDLGLKIEIFPVPIYRSEQGLALSSRNALLSEEERAEALIIHETLSYGVELAKKETNAEFVKKSMIAYFSNGTLSLEYLAIVDNTTLQEVKEISENSTACIAAFCGKVRLIDNQQFE